MTKSDDKKDDDKKDDDKKDDDKKDDKKDDAADSAADDLKKLSTKDEKPADPPPPAAKKTEYRTVPQTPTEAFKSFALDLYERARGADDPKAFPSASTSWGVVEAPKIARGLHASAVILDGIKQFNNGTLPDDLLPFQTAAHKRSQQLGQQIQNAQKLLDSPVPALWAPVEVATPFKDYKYEAPVDWGASLPSVPK